MNANQAIMQVVINTISNFWWLWLLVAILGILKTPVMKGIIGEFQVNLIAKLRLDKQIYKLFKNITLPTEDGGTTQIDHVIVSRYGVFVIETKNIRGWIFGSEHQKTWTQKIYRHTNKFQNPLHQNYKHTQTLQSALELSPESLFSVVVFIGDSEFKTPMPDNVVYAGSYIRFIKSKHQTIFTEYEVTDICRKLESGRLKPNIKTHVEHVKHVKNIVEQKQQQTENACPKCGRPMVLRTAKSGENQGNQFWGCSGFPKCRVVRAV